MAIEFFLVPMVGTGTRADPYRGRYTDDPAVVRSGCIRYSISDSAICLIEADQTYLDTVAAQPDATLIATETNLDDAIGGTRLVAISNELEAVNVPTQWLAASDTGREVIRVIAGIFQFAQRHEGLNGSAFFSDLEAAGFGLNTQWQNLSQAFRDTIQATIDDEGWTDLVIADTDQVRALLRDFAARYEPAPLIFAGFEI